MTRTILIASGLPRSFWAEALNASCYIINRCLTRPILNKTAYELFKGKKPNIIHLRLFGCKCYVHNNGKDALRKFVQGVIRLYSLDTPHTVRHTKCLIKEPCVKESVHVLFDETNSLVENDAQDEE